MDHTNCEAVWTAGLVHVEQEAWTPAAPKFSSAMSCFTAAAGWACADIDAIQAATYAEALEAPRVFVGQFSASAWIPPVLCVAERPEQAEQPPQLASQAISPNVGTV